MDHDGLFDDNTVSQLLSVATQKQMDIILLKSIG